MSWSRKYIWLGKNIPVSYFMIFIFSIIVGLQCSVNFYCIAKWPGHTHTHTHTHTYILEKIFPISINVAVSILDYHDIIKTNFLKLELNMMFSSLYYVATFQRKPLRISNFLLTKNSPNSVCTWENYLCLNILASFQIS